MLRRYIHGSNVDSPLVWLEGGGTGDRRFYHADHQGSIIALSDSNGGVLHTTSYSPYGVPDGLMPGRFAYTGQAVLPGLDLYHYKARVYSPTLGRFLQTDPIGYEDQQNLYAYVGNDPMNWTDPSGMQREEQERSVQLPWSAEGITEKEIEKSSRNETSRILEEGYTKPIARDAYTMMNQATTKAVNGCTAPCSLKSKIQSGTASPNLQSAANNNQVNTIVVGSQINAVAIVGSSLQTGAYYSVDTGEAGVAVISSGLAGMDLSGGGFTLISPTSVPKGGGTTELSGVVSMGGGPISLGMDISSEGVGYSVFVGQGLTPLSVTGGVAKGVFRPCGC